MANMKRLIEDRVAGLWRSDDPINWAEARDLEGLLTGHRENLEDFEVEDWC